MSLHLRHIISLPVSEFKLKGKHPTRKPEICHKGRVLKCHPPPHAVVDGGTFWGGGRVASGRGETKGFLKPETIGAPIILRAFSKAAKL